MNERNPDIPGWLSPAAAVAGALAEGEPVLALESTVIAHGLPRPRNLEVALELEERTRLVGCTPATIAVIGGKPTVGLDRAQLAAIATGGVAKLSTRELPLARARRIDGATTVAATARLAAECGIRVFATGGIGGVHRGLPPDVSADLLELRESALVVTCAGAKSILDLPATRELLETLGVLVLGWRTDRFPAFYTSDSGIGVDARVESAEEVAEIWRAHRELERPGAILLCVPIPEEHSLDPALVEGAIEGAMRTALSRGVTGKALTPFLLNALADSTSGATLEANVALLRNNVDVGARVAVKIAESDGR